MSGNAPELGAKSLELIREFAPGARRVGYLRNANDPLAALMLEQLHQGAQTQKFAIHPEVIRAPGELENAIAAIARERADALILSGTLSIHEQVGLALKYRLPTLQNQSSTARAGALISYSASQAERGRDVAGYVDKILKGAKPAELPVQQPAKFELVVNLKTAKILGITVPPSLLARADEVVE